MVRYRDPEMLQMERKRSLIFKLAIAILGLSLFFVIAWYVLFSFVVVKLVDMVQDDGLKVIVEEIWEGKEVKQDE